MEWKSLENKGKVEKGEEGNRDRRDMWENGFDIAINIDGINYFFRKFNLRYLYLQLLIRY